MSILWLGKGKGSGSTLFVHEEDLRITKPHLFSSSEAKATDGAPSSGSTDPVPDAVQPVPVPFAASGTLRGNQSVGDTDEPNQEDLDDSVARMFACQGHIGCNCQACRLKRGENVPDIYRRLAIFYGKVLMDSTKQ